MNDDHAVFAEWDAAYVLGALSPADRRRFEAHLAGCGACRRAIAEIAPTIGLLSRVSAEQAEGIPDAGGPAAASRARLMALGAQRARRARVVWRTAAVAAAAAVVIVVALAVSTAIAPALRSIRTVALEPVGGAPLSASVELVDVAWGTSIEVECSYDGAGQDAPAGGWPYALVVMTADGRSHEVSTWRALPGATARVSAGTALEADDIVSVEIRGIAGDRVLMRADLGSG